MAEADQVFLDAHRAITTSVLRATTEAARVALSSSTKNEAGDSAAAAIAGKSMRAEDHNEGARGVPGIKEHRQTAAGIVELIVKHQPQERRSGDRRYGDVLFACGKFGDLRIAELLAMFGGRPEAIVESVEKHLRKGYIVIEEAKPEDWKRFVSKIDELTATGVDDVEKNRRAMNFLGDDPDLAVRLRVKLTSSGITKGRALPGVEFG